MRRVLWLMLFLPSLARADAPPIESRKLADGLEVLVVENHALPVVTVEVAARNGSMTEPPEYNGLSHLYEHMFFKANQALPNQQAYMARLRELGMLWQGTTSTERVNYWFTTTTDHFRDAMVFMRDAIVSPLFDPGELARERVVVTGEIDRNESDPAYHFLHETWRHVWWKYPSYKDPLGNRQTVLAATREQMQTIQRRYYVPNNSVLVVIGDVKASDVFAQAESLYAAWKAGEDPFREHPLVQHPPLRATEVVLVEQPVDTVSLSLVWHGPSTVGAHVDATYAADLLGAAIADRASKFQKALVESGACVRAGLDWYTQMNTGPITLSLEATPDSVDRCVTTALAELPRMRAPDYLSDDERRDAALRVEVGLAHEQETTRGLAHALTYWWTSAGLDYYRGYLDHLRHVAPADIARYLDTFVVGKPFVFAVMQSPALAKERHLDVAHYRGLALAKGGAR